MSCAENLLEIAYRDLSKYEDFNATAFTSARGSTRHVCPSYQHEKNKNKKAVTIKKPARPVTQTTNTKHRKH